MSEQDPRPDEEREAEALAHALERGHGSDELPEDALETAALLRYGQDGGELGRERSEAILEEVLGSARAPESKPSPSWLKWLVPLGGLAAAGAAVLIALRVVGPGGDATAVAMPEPDVELLRAQAEAAAGSDEAASALSSRMRDHRGQLVVALGERYGR